MPQKFKKTHPASTLPLHFNSLIFLLSLSLCVQQLQCSTLCDLIRSSLQKDEKKQLSSLL